MGCATSKQQDGGDNVVSFCKERKRLLKLAVERRYAFADVHGKYNQALYAVAAAIRLFVARHSSPSSSPFLITVSSSADETLVSVTNPMFLQQKPTEPTHKVISFENQGQDQESSSQEDEEEEEDEVVCEHFNGDETQTFGWDFFNPFDEFRTEVVNRFSESSDEKLKALREEEGIPNLEEDAETKVEHGGNVESESKDVENGDGANVNQGRFRMIDTPNGRELLEALKDVEDHFVKAYHSGLDVSKMLEARRVQLQSGLEELKDSSHKLIRSITWSRPTLSRSSSCRSLLSSSSKSSSTWIESKNEMFDDYGGMESGSHSSTLGRLYAWEKKLYEEVKAGEQTRKTYERKCYKLRNSDARHDDICAGDKRRAEMTDLHTRILVALRSTESISERIRKLRDEELQPQVVELLHGLMRNWKMMMESSETQMRIMSEVQSFDCPVYGKFSDDSHRLSTLQLEAELHNWRTCFVEYVSAQKAYVEALVGWLSKFIAPEMDFFSERKTSLPPLLVTCQDWLAFTGKLPDEAVIRAMKSLQKDIRALWVQQGEEQHQKRKVDVLAKELERRVLAFQGTENRVLQSKQSDHQGLEANVRNSIEHLAEQKTLLDLFRKRVDAEKAKHQATMEETWRITVNGFQTGFSSVFKSMTEFSKATSEMYADLVNYSENANAEKEKDCETSHAEEISSYLWN
ncbi:hypothetical protein SLEP1_g52229 [Rubroshorea leprosula]|uniref:Nitrate regulatory gene2 protein-like n=1 Tax=Rubroshorea leprosula TaxID=152421 RepID=A0AAV5M891_9ROSI|nr:hypothetical protein SLEP1_g52229 [Rubroshorea leprosula]